MLFLGLLLLELLALFFLSRMLISTLGIFFHQVTKSYKTTVNILATLFFVGTVVHEIAHYLTALVLKVPAGHITLWPEVHGTQIKLGSVRIAETSLIKRTLIGIAPLFLGTLGIFSILYYCYTLNVFHNITLDVFLTYIIFTISNNMYSSKKDLEGLILFLVVLLIAVAILSFVSYTSHMHIPQILIPFIKLADVFFFIPVCINLSIIATINLIFRLTR